MKSIHLSNLASFLAFVFVLMSQPVYAQDWSGVLKGILKGDATTNKVIGAIKSVTDVQLGQVTPGTGAPADAQGQVVLYRTAWCGYCKRAAEYMRTKNIAFVERDIETNPAYKAEYKRLGGTGGVPFIVMGTKTLSGFNETHFSRAYAEFQQNEGAATPASAQAPTRGVAVNASAPLQSGDTMIGKIPGIHVHPQPSKASQAMLVLGKGDEVIYMGEERDGFYRVTTSKGEGWVDKLLVRRP